MKDHDDDYYPDPQPIEIPIEDEIDLHTFQPRDIPEVVREYIREAARLGFEEVRVIHGKGTGTLKGAVLEYLSGHPLVSRHYAAAPGEGNGGVTIVELQ